MASPDRFSLPGPRLYDPDQLASGRHVPPDDSPELTVSQIYERWFVPVILRGERGASAGTVAVYDDAIAWWCRITGDPPAWQVDEYTTAEFAQKLPITPYRRGLAGGELFLSRQSCEKHKGSMRTILKAIRERKGLVGPDARLVSKRPKCKPKACFTLTQAQTLCATAMDMHSPIGQPYRPGLWWRAFLSLLFYTGLRVGSVLALRWEHVEEREDGLWLDVPEALVEKTHKWKEMPLHAEAASACDALRTWSEGRLLPLWPHHRRTLGDHHALLQRKARIRLPKGKPLELQAWRRTYSDQLARLGLNTAHEIARRALDHSDLRITTGHYVCIEHELMRQMPRLYVPEDNQQLLF